MITTVPECTASQLLSKYKWVEAGSAEGSRKNFRFKSGVYVIVSNETLLYAGSSCALSIRISGHEKVKAAKNLGYKNIQVFMLEVPNSKEMEIQLIMNYMPLLNTYHAHKNQKIQKITIQCFLEEMKKYDVISKGRGKEIAKTCKISYNAYLNYRNGRGSDEQVMSIIITECKNRALSMRYYLNALSFLN